MSSTCSCAVTDSTTIASHPLFSLACPVCCVQPCTEEVCPDRLAQAPCAHRCTSVWTLCTPRLLWLQALLQGQRAADQGRTAGHQLADQLVPWPARRSEVECIGVVWASFSTACLFGLRCLLVAGVHSERHTDNFGQDAMLMSGQM